MKYSVSAGTVQLLASVVEKLGVDKDALYQGIELDEALLTNPDTRIEIPVLQRLWRKAIELSGNEDMPLLFGEAVNPYSLGVLSYLMMNCVTIGEALRVLCTYQDVNCAGIKTTVETGNGFSLMKVEVMDADILVKSYALDSELSSYVTVIRRLLEVDLPIHHIYFAYPRPASTTTHERIFGTDQLIFDHPFSGISFPAAILEARIANANPTLFPLFEAHLKEALHKVTKFNTVAGRIREQIIQRLKGEAPKLSRIAKDIGMGERNIQLKLKEEGTNFQSLLDEIRKETAISYLRENNLSITDIAFLIGYSEVSVFSKSFSKWTGKTPQAYRNQVIRN